MPLKPRNPRVIAYIRQSKDLIELLQTHNPTSSDVNRQGHERLEESNDLEGTAETAPGHQKDQSFGVLGLLYRIQNLHSKLRNPQFQLVYNHHQAARLGALV